jgi:heme exporter protein B
MTRAMAARQYVSDVAVLARKDARLELRSRDTVPAMLLFVVGALVVFHFAVPADLDEETERVVSFGLLWVALLFTAILGLTRAFVAEREQRLIDALVLAPCDRSAIWLAKTIAVVAFLLLAELIALPAFALFFVPVGGATIAAVLLANIGIAAVGTVLSAVSAASRTRELLLPLLLLPLAIPIIVGGIGASVTDEPAQFLAFLALYDAVFAIISWSTFEYVVTE